MFDFKSLTRTLGLSTAGALFTAMTLVNAFAAPLAIKDSPLFLADNTAPLNMLVMGRDHRIYYEAYNDASDLDGDGTLDTRYKPATIDYFGYFDSFKCYDYSGGMFVPANVSATKQCSSKWSGDWLNYMTMSRVDALRKVLYGGLRSTDSTTDTVLQRSYIPQDAHSWGKEYTSIAVDGYDIRQYTPLALPAANRRHLFANTTPSADANATGSTNPAVNGVPLPKFRVLLDRQNRVWEWVSKERPVAGTTIDNSQHSGGTNDAVTLGHDLNVRVRVCVASLEEGNCKVYGTSKKPTGLLQDYGENNAMMFGLLSGSYARPHSGGVLRKAVSSITNEIIAASGQFDYTLDPPGIISSMDRFRVTSFNGDTYACGWITDSADAASSCSMWGNPTAEMMYEAVRYFAGRSGATSDYNAGSDPEEATLGLKKAPWSNPYATQPRCSKPFETVVSDVSPSFDSDELPGSYFNSWTGNDPVAGFNASALGNTIFNSEIGAPGQYYIGQSGALTPGSPPSPKTVTSFGNIRGLSPEAPTKQGSYYDASVAYYGLQNDLNAANGEQKLQTFAVALASPLPQIKIPVAGGRNITLVPFAKSVGGCLGVNGAGAYQPTNQIVDFYVDSLTATSGRFRVNYEDVEQGADHDMDAIAIYEYTVNGNGTVTVTVTSEYSAGCITQHMGYVISGTSAQDGAYLVVRDVDTDGSGNDVDYYLDTPPGQPVGGTWADGQPLPLVAARTFTPGSTTGASLLKDPLWYAAKWGGFRDSDGDGTPNLPAEWDEDNDGDPDNYFLVTNALTLKDQLTKAFNDIINRNASSSAAAINSGSIGSTTRIYQAKFSSQFWSGQLLAYPISTSGVLGAVSWDAATMMPAAGSRNILTVNSNLTAVGGYNLNRTGVPFTWAGIDATRRAQLQPLDALGSDRLDYLRGVRTKEIPASGGIFRRRAGTLGDIINSAPVFMGAPPFLYRDSMEANPYSAFRSAQASRPGMVYVGANDGMLHGFDATTGAERFAFVPASVFRSLYKLADPSYAHQYFVDGSPTVIDAYYNSAWHTVLAGGLNKGGQGVYALDVTNPAGITQANAATTFLWEFSDLSDVDMGYSYSRPAIVKLKNGQWAAVFGNGYNNTESSPTDTRVSTTGNAVLYIVDIQTGGVIRKLNTNFGMSRDPLALSRPNGLSTPLLVDRDNDGVVEYAYAGDLFGNLWKFDLTDPAPANWKVAYGPAATPVPLFTAKDGTGVNQPITERPTVAFGPNGVGNLVLFGTGKFLEPDDRDISKLKPQSFYGIYDRNTGVQATDVVANRSSLVQQTITLERTVTLGGIDFRLRETSKNAVDPATKSGWFIDLISPSGFNGEMQITDPVYRNGRVVFTTLIPETDVCAFGGTSWLMEMDALTGSQLDIAPLDLDNNQLFDEAAFSGMQMDAIASRAAVLTAQTGSQPPSEFKVIADTGGNVRVIRENPGAGSLDRQSWRQVR